MKGRAVELTDDEATAVVSSLMNLARRANPAALTEHVLLETSVSPDLKSSLRSAYQKMNAPLPEVEWAAGGLV